MTADFVPQLAMVWPNWAWGLAGVVFLASSVLLVLTVLIQKPQGGGLSGAFGAGSSSGQTAFGTKTGDALTVFTIIMFAVFVIMAIVMNFASESIVHPKAAPAAEVTPPATPDGGQTPATGTAPATPTDKPAEKPAEKPADAPAEKPAVQPPATGTPAPATAPAPAQPETAKPAEPAPGSPKR